MTPHLLIRVENTGEIGRILFFCLMKYAIPSSKSKSCFFFNAISTNMKNLAGKGNGLCHCE